MTTKISDTEIGVEQSLKEDSQGEFCKALSDFFRDHQQRMKQTMDRGVARDEFASYSALVQAAAAAAEATEKLWKSLHNKP